MAPNSQMLAVGGIVSKLWFSLKLWKERGRGRERRVREREQLYSFTHNYTSIRINRSSSTDQILIVYTHNIIVVYTVIHCACVIPVQSIEHFNGD